MTPFRFWFENKLNGIFTEEEISRIRNITLRDIIKSTTNIDETMLQEDVGKISNLGFDSSEALILLSQIQGT